MLCHYLDQDLNYTTWVIIKLSEISTEILIFTKPGKTTVRTSDIYFIRTIAVGMGNKRTYV